MFTKSQTNVKLDEEIAASLEQLAQHRDSDEYDSIVERVSRLQKLKTEPVLRAPSPDTMLIVGANLFGLLLLAAVEREHPLTTKAMNFVLRPK